MFVNVDIYVCIVYMFCLFVCIFCIVDINIGYMFLCWREGEDVINVYVVFIGVRIEGGGGFSFFMFFVK